MNRYTNLLLISSMVISLASPTAARSKAQPPNALKDVPQSHWASDSVKELYDSGVMVGDPNGAFRGGSALSRYEMAVALSSLINNFNKELLEDREDLASLVNIMEQFQKEISALNQKISQIDKEVGEATGTARTAQEQSIELTNRIDQTGEDVSMLKSDVEKLKNRGLIYGTIIKGAANDVKSVGKGIAYVAKKITSDSSEDAANKEVDAEVVEQVVLPKPSKTEKLIQEHKVTHTHTTVETSTPVEVEREVTVEEVEPEPAYEEPVKKTIKVSPKEKALMEDVTPTHTYVPRMQASPALQKTPSYETPKTQTPAPRKISKQEESTYDSQEQDGELIQEIHQTLEEMH